MKDYSKIKKNLKSKIDYDDEISKLKIHNKSLAEDSKKNDEQISKLEEKELKIRSLKELSNLERMYKLLLNEISIKNYRIKNLINNRDFEINNRKILLNKSYKIQKNKEVSSSVGSRECLLLKITIKIIELESEKNILLETIELNDLNKKLCGLKEQLGLISKEERLSGQVKLSKDNQELSERLNNEIPDELSENYKLLNAKKNDLDFGRGYIDELTKNTRGKAINDLNTYDQNTLNYISNIYSSRK